MNAITTAVVPATTTTEAAALIEDLTGFHPVLDRLAAAFGDVLNADLTADQSMAAVAVLGALNNGNIATLLGLTLRHVANPDTNPALADLDDVRKQTLRRSGAEYAAAITEQHIEQAAAEACAAIDLTCPTD